MGGELGIRMDSTMTYGREIVKKNAPFREECWVTMLQAHFTQTPMHCNHKETLSNLFLTEGSGGALEQQGRGTHLKEGGKLKICLMSTAPLRTTQGWG